MSRIWIAGMLLGVAALVGCKDERSASGKRAGSLSTEQIAAFKAKGDWCAEHGVPESQCTICNPELHEGSHDHEHDHDHDHAHRPSIVRLTPQAVRNHQIRVEPAQKRTLAETITVPARVSLNQNKIVHVGSPLSGQVRQIDVGLGDNVNTGDVLLVIVSPELGEAQSDFLTKQAAVTIAEPAVELARSSYERAKRLYEESQGIALTEVHKRQAEYQAAEGALRSARVALTAARNRLRLLGMSADSINSLAQSGEIDPMLPVRAGIAGEVIERNVTTGQFVSPADGPLLVLADTTTLWVLASMPEAKLGWIAEGSTVEVRVPALGRRTFQGTLALVAPSVSLATRTGTVRIEVAKGDSGLRPGMFAQAVITASEEGSEPVLAIAEQAIQMIDGQPTVFVPVEGEDGSFVKRAIRAGVPVGGQVPVLDGLSVGEPVVVSGSFILKAELGKAGAAHEH